MGGFFSEKNDDAWKSFLKDLLQIEEEKSCAVGVFDFSISEDNEDVSKIVMVSW